METKVAALVLVGVLVGGAVLLQQKGDTSVKDTADLAASSQGAAHSGGNAGNTGSGVNNGNGNQTSSASDTKDKGNAISNSNGSSLETKDTKGDKGAPKNETHLTTRNGLPTLDDGSVAIWALQTKKSFITIPDDIASQLFE